MRAGEATIDGVAVTISGLCLVHCLFLPLAGALIPMVSVLAESEWIHQGLVLLAVPCVVLGVLSPIKLDRMWIFYGLALAGLAGLGAAAFVEALHDHEVALTVFGSAALASAHVWRWTALRRAA